MEVSIRESCAAVLPGLPGALARELNALLRIGTGMAQDIVIPSLAVACSLVILEPHAPLADEREVAVLHSQLTAGGPRRAVLFALVKARESEDALAGIQRQLLRTGALLPSATSSLHLVGLRTAADLVTHLAALAAIWQAETSLTTRWQLARADVFSTIGAQQRRLLCALAPEALSSHESNLLQEGFTSLADVVRADLSALVELSLEQTTAEAIDGFCATDYSTA